LHAKTRQEITISLRSVGAKRVLVVQRKLSGAILRRVDVTGMDKAAVQALGATLKLQHSHRVAE